MKPFVKICLGLLVALVLLAAGGYVAFWQSLETHINQQIETIWNEAAADGVIITGKKPKLEGFPGVPVVHFQGSVTDATGMVLNFPELTYRGFPVPGRRMSLELPAGLSVTGPSLPEPAILTEAHLRILLPYNLPHGATAEDMASWQKSGGSIPIESLFIKSELLRIEGQCSIGLDEKLQLTGTINAKVTGMDALLADLSEKKIIQGKSAAMAQSFLQALIQRDPVTGDTYFMTALRIQNRGVFVGPLRVASLPELFWNTDSQPVRRR